TDDAPAVDEVEGGLTTRRADLVLLDLDGAHLADLEFAVLRVGDLGGGRSTNLEAHGGVELEGAATRGGTRVAVHHTDLLADLVDEDHHCVRLTGGVGDETESFGHHAGLGTDLQVGEFAFQLNLRGERCHRVDADYVSSSRFEDLAGDV